jgi:hypothetical protein
VAAIPSLYTLVRNTSGKKLFFGYLRPQGITLADDEEYAVPGNLVDAFRRDGRKLRALEADLAAKALAIISTPAAVVIDSATFAVKTVGVTSGALALSDPSYGAFKGRLTAAFTAVGAQTAAIATATLTFSQALAASGLPLASLSLTRDAVAVPLTVAPTLSSGAIWTVPSLTSLTGTNGTYVLRAVASAAILDTFGNALFADVTVTWVKS